MALVLDAAIVITEILIGHRFNLAGLLAAGPLLACARCNGRTTALVAGYAIALAAIVGWVIGTTGARAEGYRVGAVFIAGIFAVLLAVIRSRREGALIRISERVQRAILRPLPAELGGVAFASHYQSATREAMVGGDLYDITMTQFGPRFIIGDVKGKGLDAVGLCAAVLAVFRELASASQAVG
jgi:sigma-B regulation protein RsbU (phosphoserine phosphatase)